MAGIKKVQKVEFKTQEDKQPQIYTALYYNDIIRLLVDYKIPVAQQTLDALKQHSVYFIKGELDTIQR